jgi:Rrf2 family protein
MSTFFSRRCDYALQALLFVADNKTVAMTSIKELTGELGIPYYFLAKILRDLTRKGLLVSHKGPRGGFALSRPAKSITLFDIIEAVDEAGFATNCVLGFPECSEQKPCALHSRWSALRPQIVSLFAEKSIVELAGDMRKPGFSGVLDRVKALTDSD